MFNVLNHPWAMRQEDFESLVAQWPKIRLEVEAAKPAALSARMAERVAVLPISGVITQKPTILSRYFDVTSTEEFGQVFDAMAGDKVISAIVLDVNSPGGSVFGVQELGQKIREARGVKPIVAVANSLAASAAYWLAAQADRIVASPSAMVGSIGVFASHTDVSRFEERMGYKTTMVSAGRYKTEGHPFAPLDDPARAAMQKTVNDYYDSFVSEVAKGRMASQSVVRGGYGEGRTLTANGAKAAGMVDKIGTLDEVIGKLMARGQSKSARAEVDEDFAFAQFAEQSESNKEPESEDKDLAFMLRHRIALMEMT